MSRLVILGAGGLGREVHDVVLAEGRSADGAAREFIGFVDPNPDEQLLATRDAPWLGGDEALSTLAGCTYVLGVGTPALKRRLAARAEDAGLTAAPPLVHPTASFGVDVALGAGTVVCAHASLTTNIRLGQHVLLNLNVTVGHDAVIGNFVTVNPGSTISGNVTLEEEVLVGTNAAILEKITVGARSTVGAGGVVVRQLPADVVAVGVPARPIQGDR